jgi:phytoene synthase
MSLPGHLDAEELAACRAALRTGSRSFHAASRVLPARVRLPASALYAFCRAADDAVDQGDDAAAAVAALRRRLDRVYDPASRGAAMPLPERALAAVVRAHGIPRALPEALLEGFEWDAQGRRYETFDAVCDYASRVAGSVGAMMALVMGVREPAALARACELGVAMQLSNIARDVGEDAAMGRLYLPATWMREAGLEPVQWLRDPVPGDALATVVQRLLQHADALYARAGAGVARLPVDCRPGINAARFLYAAIGDQVRHNGAGTLHRRAVVPRARQWGLLAQAACHLFPGEAQGDAPALPAVQHLVNAVPPSTPQREENRVEWVITLFERLERNERLPARVPRVVRS